MDEIRIVEFGCYFAAPLVGQYLRQMGCHVVSVKRPSAARGRRAEETYMRGLSDRLDRGKRIVHLNLPDDVDEALRLVRESDVVIENFAPGVMRRLGLADVRAHNPNVVFVSMPGFAPDDVDFDHLRAYESVIMACAGVFNDMGLNRTLLGVEASYTELPLASVYASVHAAFAIACAVYRGGGNRIIVPLASALSETMVHNSLKFGVDECYQSARSKRIAQQDTLPVTWGELHDLLDPFFCTYTCRDGRPFYLVAPGHIRHQRKTLQLLSIADAKYADANLYHDSVPTGLGRGHVEATDAAHLRARMRSAFATRDASEWELAFGEAGVPAAATRTLQEWMATEHVRDSKLIAADGTPANIGWLAEPHEVPVRTAASSGPHCLSGIKVVDLSNVIAGPTIGYSLARMGADVVKVDPVHSLYAPDITVVYGLAANRGKKSYLIDVVAPDGRRALEALLIDADVLIVNCTTACLARLRLTKGDLHRLNPRLILARFDAWSGPGEQSARMSAYNGYDDTVQAATGIMARFGGGLETPEEHAHIGTIDVVAGIAGAFTVVAALLERKHKGKVYVARSSLAAVGQYLQLPFLFGNTRPTYGSGRTCIGEHRLHRCYRARDGWVFVVASLHNDDEEADAAMHRALGPVFNWEGACASLDALELCHRLTQQGVSACVLRNMETMRQTYMLRDTKEPVTTSRTFAFHSMYNHPIGSLQIVAPIALRMDHIPRILTHAPKYGAHTHELTVTPSSSFSCAWSVSYMPRTPPCAACACRGLRRFVLPCDHTVCALCAFDILCQVCGRAHDVLMISGKVQEWRNMYAGWRRGEAQGAHNTSHPEHVWNARTHARRESSDRHQSLSRSRSVPHLSVPTRCSPSSGNQSIRNSKTEHTALRDIPFRTASRESMTSL